MIANPQAVRAADLVLRRRRVRASMIEWARENKYEPAKHHRFLIEKLEAVVRGEIKRLMVFLPPGSAKSTYCTVLFPPWYLQSGNRSILTASHSDTLAESFGRRARNLVAMHASVLGYTLRSDSKAAGDWHTSNGGLFFCAGVGTKVAGHRFHLGLIDDPIGKKEDAESKPIRDKIWDWYNYDFLPRQEPDAAVVLIQTRWHEDDLAGRLLAAEGGDWTVIAIPLIAGIGDPLGRQPGEALWPEYFTGAQIEKARQSPAFSSLYQQTPTPDSGDYFHKEWFADATYKSEAELPERLRPYAGSDFALSKDEEADRHCIIPAGMDEYGDLWVLPNVWWPRTDNRPAPDEVVQEMFRLTKKHRFLFWYAGKDHITGSLRPYIEKVSGEDLVFIPFEELSDRRDKQLKAQSIRGMARQGRVHLPAFADWFPDAMEELMRFPLGTHDDFVDALANLGRGLSTQVAARPKPKEVTESLSPPVPTLGWVRDQCRRQDNAANMAGVGM